MDIPGSKEIKDQSLGGRVFSFVGRVLLAIGIPFIAFFVLYQGFLFLRDSNASRGIIAAVAIVWGVGGVALLYWIFNGLVENFPDVWRTRFLPFVFVGPAMAILAWYLAIPTLRTFWISLFGRDGPPQELNFLQQFTSSAFVGLSNYKAVFTEDLMLEAFRNNLMWIIFGSTFSVIFGLIIAVLADRSSFEKLAKSLIFLPYAISFVGASIIWIFQPLGNDQVQGYAHQDVEDRPDRALKDVTRWREPGFVERDIPGLDPAHGQKSHRSTGGHG